MAPAAAVPAFPTLGSTELIIILVIVVILFGVGKLPKVLKQLGEGVKEFRDASSKEGEDASKKDAAARAEEQVEKKL